MFGFIRRKIINRMILQEIDRIYAKRRELINNYKHDPENHKAKNFFKQELSKYDGGIVALNILKLKIEGRIK